MKGIAVAIDQKFYYKLSSNVIIELKIKYTQIALSCLKNVENSFTF